MKITYLLLLVGTLLIVFFKPKQEEESLLIERIEHLRSRFALQEKEMINALSLKSEFIRNMQHEYHTPMTGIISMSQMLYDSYYSLTDEERIEAAGIIFKSFLRLESFDSNLTSLAKLSSPKYELKYEDIDFSNLVSERLLICRKLYEEDDQRTFVVHIPENIYLKADKYYLGQMLDNLIINAITYCPSGTITITAEHIKLLSVTLCIRDEGMGIPQAELLEVFGEFIVSSKTKTPSGGRGIGLAVCKKIIEAHKGSIVADSDGHSWTTFTVFLPLNQ